MRAVQQVRALFMLTYSEDTTAMTCSITKTTFKVTIQDRVVYVDASREAALQIQRRIENRWNEYTQWVEVDPQGTYTRTQINHLAFTLELVRQRHNT